MSRDQATADAIRAAATSARLLDLSGSDAAAWRAAVAGELRDLVDADAAVLAVEGPDEDSFLALGIDDAIVREYRERFAGLDLGMARLRRVDRELWTRAMLWNRGELARSTYYNDFAKRHHLVDSIGVSLRIFDVWMRVALLRTSPVRRSRQVRRLRLLARMLPGLRTGATLLAWARRYERAAMQVIDRVPDPVGLFDVTGRTLHQNAAFTRAAAEVESSRLAALIQRVVRSVAESARPGRLGGARDAPGANGATGEWRATGSLVPELDGRSAAILVSVNRRREDPTALDAVRRRYALTAREVEVMRLLRRRRSNAEIAATLQVSAATARHHTESVLLKLGLHSRRDVERFRPEPRTEAGGSHD